MSDSKFFVTWQKMRARCYYKKHKNFAYYGGRGIRVCNAWLTDFWAFHSWCMRFYGGKGTTLDRINNDGNYEPDNCRWADKGTQSRNSRIRCTNTSGYKGIHPRKDTNKFRAVVTHEYKIHNVGNYDTAEQAAMARDAYIIANNLPHKLQVLLPEVV